MRRLPVLATVLLLPLAARAEEPLVDKVHQGSGALMFTLGGLFNSTPGELDGIGVGGRYFASNTLAYRAGVGFNFFSDETDPDGNDNTQTVSGSVIALEGGVELIILRSPSVYLYTGGIGQVGLTSNTTKQETAGDDNKVEDSGFGITLAGLLGANYFFTQQVSLGAEYRAGLEYATSERKDVQETKHLKLGTGVVGFHLAFWWH